MHDRKDLFKLCTIQCISRTFFFDVWFLSFHFESRTMLDWSTDAAKNGPVEISFTCYAVPGLARSRRSNCPNLSYKFQPAQKSTNCGTGELGIRMKLLNCPEIAKCGIYEKTPTRAAICPASHEACFLERYILSGLSSYTSSRLFRFAANISRKIDWEDR